MKSIKNSLKIDKVTGPCASEVPYQPTNLISYESRTGVILSGIPFPQNGLPATVTIFTPTGKCSTLKILDGRGLKTGKVGGVCKLHILQNRQKLHALAVQIAENSGMLLQSNIFWNSI
jgi:hypothetical protein